MRLLRRFLPLLALLAAMAALWASGAAGALTWQGLARNHAALTAWAGANPLLAPVAYVVAYIIVTAVSLPEAALVTLVGGLLFGTLLGGILAVIGATIGGVVLFLVARSALGDSLVRRGGKTLARTRARLRRDGFSYLLAIRLIPLIPFWLVNLAAAIGGMRLLPYALATLIGIVPGTMVFASVGAGLGEVLARGEAPDVSVIFSAHVLGPLIALAALSLIPIAWRRRAAK